MSFRKLLLTLFLSLMLYAQAYSLVVGLQSATIITPERLEDLQDTDLEDIVTVDPFLPSRTAVHSAASGRLSSDWQAVPVMPTLLAGLICIYFWFMWKPPLRITKTWRAPELLSSFKQRPLYINHRQLLI